MLCLFNETKWNSVLFIVFLNVLLQVFGSFCLYSSRISLGVAGGEHAAYLSPKLSSFSSWQSEPDISTWQLSELVNQLPSALPSRAVPGSPSVLTPRRRPCRLPDSSMVKISLLRIGAAT